MWCCIKHTKSIVLWAPAHLSVEKFFQVSEEGFFFLSYSWLVLFKVSSENCVDTAWAHHVLGFQGVWGWVFYFFFPFLCKNPEHLKLVLVSPGIFKNLCPRDKNELANAIKLLEARRWIWLSVTCQITEGSEACILIRYLRYTVIVQFRIAVWNTVVWITAKVAYSPFLCDQYSFKITLYFYKF